MRFQFRLYKPVIMYQRNKQCSEIFKQGLVSSEMFSFTQMKGVTSTALVDFTSRCTWSCGQEFSLHASSPNRNLFQFQNKDTRMYGRCGCNVSSVLPKTFSPVLLYQRPFDIKTNSFDEETDSQLSEIIGGCTNETSSAFQSVRPRSVSESNVKYHQHPIPRRYFPTTHHPCATFDVDNTFHPSKMVCEKSTSTQHLHHAMNDVYSINKKQVFSHESAKLPLLHNDSANMKFFLDTKFGCLDNFGDVSGNTDDVTLSMKADQCTNGDCQPNLEHICDSYLDLFNELPMTFPMENVEMEERKNRKYKCPHCNVCCTNKGQLKGHVRVHTGEKPFVCDFDHCKRCFARNEELTRHRRIHLGLKPHQCVVCTKSFGRKDHLNKHEKTHLKTADKKVHLCGIIGCPQSYTRSDALARHQWSAHAIKAKSTKWRREDAVPINVPKL